MESAIGNTDQWFTLANGLSASRFLLAALLAIALVNGAWWSAAVLFVVACVTDVLDGRIARQRAVTSSFGGKLDHSADAFFVVCGIASLSYVGLIPVLLAPLIVLAFAQYYWDARKTHEGKLRPSRLGKWNGIAYFVIVGIAIGHVVTAELFFFLDEANYWFGWVLVFSTLVSIVQRYRASGNATTKT